MTLAQSWVVDAASWGHSETCDHLAISPLNSLWCGYWNVPEIDALWRFMKFTGTVDLARDYTRDYTRDLASDSAGDITRDLDFARYFARYFAIYISI